MESAEDANKDMKSIVKESYNRYISYGGQLMHRYNLSNLPWNSALKLDKETKLSDVIREIEVIEEE